MQQRVATPSSSSSSDLDGAKADGAHRNVSTVGHGTSVTSLPSLDLVSLPYTRPCEDHRRASAPSRSVPGEATGAPREAPSAPPLVLPDVSPPPASSRAPTQVPAPGEIENSIAATNAVTATAFSSSTATCLAPATAATPLIQPVFSGRRVPVTNDGAAQQLRGYGRGDSLFDLTRQSSDEDTRVLHDLSRQAPTPQRSLQAATAATRAATPTPTTTTTVSASSSVLGLHRFSPSFTASWSAVEARLRADAETLMVDPDAPRPARRLQGNLTSFSSGEMAHSGGGGGSLLSSAARRNPTTPSMEAVHSVTLEMSVCGSTRKTPQASLSDVEASADASRPLLDSRSESGGGANDDTHDSGGSTSVYQRRKLKVTSSPLLGTPVFGGTSTRCAPRPRVPPKGEQGGVALATGLAAPDGRVGRARYRGGQHGSESERALLLHLMPPTLPERTQLTQSVNSSTQSASARTDAPLAFDEVWEGGTMSSVGDGDEPRRETLDGGSVESPLYDDDDDNASKRFERDGDAPLRRKTSASTRVAKAVSDAAKPNEHTEDGLFHGACSSRGNSAAVPTGVFEASQTQDEKGVSSHLVSATFPQRRPSWPATVQGSWPSGSLDGRHCLSDVAIASGFADSSLRSAPLYNAVAPPQPLSLRPTANAMQLMGCRGDAGLGAHHSTSVLELPVFVSLSDEVGRVPAEVEARDTKTHSATKMPQRQPQPQPRGGTGYAPRSCLHFGNSSSCEVGEEKMRSGREEEEGSDTAAALIDFADASHTGCGSDSDSSQLSHSTLRARRPPYPKLPTPCEGSLTPLTTLQGATTSTSAQAEGSKRRSHGREGRRRHKRSPFAPVPALSVSLCGTAPTTTTAKEDEDDHHEVDAAEHVRILSRVIHTASSSASSFTPAEEEQTVAPGVPCCEKSEDPSRRTLYDDLTSPTSQSHQMLGSLAQPTSPLPSSTSSSSSSSPPALAASHWHVRLLWILLPYGAFVALLALATFIVTHVVSQGIVSNFLAERHTYVRSELVAFMEDVTLLPAMASEIFTSTFLMNVSHPSPHNLPLPPPRSIVRSLCAAIKFTDLADGLVTLTYAALSSSEARDEVLYVPAQSRETVTRQDVAAVAAARGRAIMFTDEEAGGVMWVPPHQDDGTSCVPAFDLRDFAAVIYNSCLYERFLCNPLRSYIEDHGDNAEPSSARSQTDGSDNDATKETRTAFAFCDFGRRSEYFAAAYQDTEYASEGKDPDASAYVNAIDPVSLDITRPLFPLRMMPPGISGDRLAHLSHVLPIVHDWKKAVARGDGSEDRVSRWWISSEPYECPSIMYVHPFYTQDRSQPSFISCRLEADLLLRQYVERNLKQGNAPLQQARVMLLSPRRPDRFIARGSDNASDPRAEWNGEAVLVDIVARSWTIDEGQSAQRRRRHDRFAAPSDKNENGAGTVPPTAEEAAERRSWMPWFYAGETALKASLEDVGDDLVQAALKVLDIRGYAAQMLYCMDEFSSAVDPNANADGVVCERGGAVVAPQLQVGASERRPALSASPAASLYTLHLGDGRHTFMPTVFRQFFYSGEKVAVSVSAVRMSSSFSAMVVIVTPAAAATAGMRDYEFLKRCAPALGVAWVAAAVTYMVYMVLTRYVQLPLISIEQQLLKTVEMSGWRAHRQSSVIPVVVGAVEAVAAPTCTGNVCVEASEPTKSGEGGASYTVRTAVDVDPVTPSNEQAALCRGRGDPSSQGDRNSSREAKEKTKTSCGLGGGTEGSEGSARSNHSQSAATAVARASDEPNGQLPAPDGEAPQTAWIRAAEDAVGVDATPDSRGRASSKLAGRLRDALPCRAVRASVRRVIELLLPCVLRWSSSLIQQQVLRGMYDWCCTWLCGCPRHLLNLRLAEVAELQTMSRALRHRVQELQKYIPESFDPCDVSALMHSSTSTWGHPTTGTCGSTSIAPAMGDLKSAATSVVAPAPLAFSTTDNNNTTGHRPGSSGSGGIQSSPQMMAASNSHFAMSSVSSINASRWIRRFHLRYGSRLAITPVTSALPSNAADGAEERGGHSDASHAGATSTGAGAAASVSSEQQVSRRSLQSLSEDIFSSSVTPVVRRSVIAARWLASSHEDPTASVGPLRLSGEAASSSFSPLEGTLGEALRSHHDPSASLPYSPFPFLWTPQRMWKGGQQILQLIPQTPSAASRTSISSSTSPPSLQQQGSNEAPRRGSLWFRSKQFLQRTASRLADTRKQQGSLTPLAAIQKPASPFSVTLSVPPTSASSSLPAARGTSSGDDAAHEQQKQQQPQQQPRSTARVARPSRFTKCLCSMLSIHVHIDRELKILAHLPEIVELVDETVRKYGGHFDVFLPEMFYASFGSRVRLKDHALLATRCAVEIYSRLSPSALLYCTFVVDTSIFQVGFCGVPGYKGYMLWGRPAGVLLWRQQLLTGFRFFVTDAVVPLIRHQFRAIPTDVIVIDSEPNKPSVVLYVLTPGSVQVPWWDTFSNLAHQAFLHVVRGHYETAVTLYDELLRMPSVTMFMVYTALMAHERVLVENRAGLSPPELARQLDELNVRGISELCRDENFVIRIFASAFPWIRESEGRTSEEGSEGTDTSRHTPHLTATSPKGKRRGRQPPASPTAEDHPSGEDDDPLEWTLTSCNASGTSPSRWSASAATGTSVPTHALTSSISGNRRARVDRESSVVKVSTNSIGVAGRAAKMKGSLSPGPIQDDVSGAASENAEEDETDLEEDEEEEEEEAAAAAALQKVVIPHMEYQGIILRVVDATGSTWQLAKEPVSNSFTPRSTEAPHTFVAISSSGQTAEIQVYRVAQTPEEFSRWASDALLTRSPPPPQQWDSVHSLVHVTPTASLTDRLLSPLQGALNDDASGSMARLMTPLSTTEGCPPGQVLGCSGASDSRTALARYRTTKVPAAARVSLESPQTSPVSFSLQHRSLRSFPPGSSEGQLPPTQVITPLSSEAGVSKVLPASIVTPPAALEGRDRMQRRAWGFSGVVTSPCTSHESPVLTNLGLAFVAASAPPNVDIAIMQDVPRRFGHGNVLQLISMAATPTHVYCVTESFAGCTLRETVNRFGSRLALAAARKCCVSLLRALEYLHVSRGVVHGRMQPEHVIIGVEGNCKLSGMSYLYDWALPDRALHARLTQRCAAYCAPEVNMGAEPTPASDIYAFGLLLLQLLTGGVPWTWSATHEPTSEDGKELLHITADNDRFLSTAATGVLELRQYGQKRNLYNEAPAAQLGRHVRENSGGGSAAAEREHHRHRSNLHTPRRQRDVTLTSPVASLSAPKGPVSRLTAFASHGDVEEDPAMLRVLEGCLAHAPSHRKSASRLLELLTEI